MFIECKWKDKVNPNKIQWHLKEKSKKVNWNPGQKEDHFCIIARSFSSKLEDTRNTITFSIDDLTKTFRTRKQ